MSRSFNNNVTVSGAVQIILLACDSFYEISIICNENCVVKYIRLF